MKNMDEEEENNKDSEVKFHKSLPEDNEEEAPKSNVKFRKSVDISGDDEVSQAVIDSLNAPDIITVNSDEADISNIDVITPDEEKPIEEIVKGSVTADSISKVNPEEESNNWDDVITPEHSEEDLKEVEESEDEEYYDDEYYEAATDMNSPLRKNTIHRGDYVSEKSDKEKNSLKALARSLNEMRNELKYIDASLKEIENPTQIDDVYVIDRTEPEEEEDNDDTIIPEHVEEVKETGNEVQDYRSSVDDDLDSIIIGINKDISKIEKRRAKLNNVLKTKDDRKIPKEVNDMEKFISTYSEAKNIRITTPAQLYERPIGEVSVDIDDIIKQEGPIHINDLIFRLRESCKLKRAGTKFKSAINLALEYSEEQGTVRRNDDFLFYTGSKMVPVRKRIKPNIDFICDEEIKQNVLLVLQLQQSVETQKLVKKVANNFGFKSTSQKTSKRITDVVDLMIAKEEATNNNGRIELL